MQLGLIDMGKPKIVNKSLTKLPAGKGLTSWLSFVMFKCVFVTFPCGIMGQVWYFIV